VPAPTPASYDLCRKVLEELYLQDLPGLAVGVNHAEQFRRTLRAVLAADRKDNPAAWPGLRIKLSLNPREVWLIRNNEDVSQGSPGSSEEVI
jgi:hypothetical protein